MDMGPTGTLAASDTQTAITRENGAAAQSGPAAAEETSLSAVQDRMRHGTFTSAK